VGHIKDIKTFKIPLYRMLPRHVFQGSLPSIIDFSVLTAETGLKVVDLSDLSMHPHHHNLGNKWCSGDNRERAFLKKNCEEPSQSYQKMVQVFNQSLENVTGGTCRDALIGSAFSMRNEFSAHDKNASHLFDNFFFGYPFNPNFLFLLEKSIRNFLQQDMLECTSG
jgi:hypothetical protein